MELKERKVLQQHSKVSLMLRQILISSKNNPTIQKELLRIQ